MSKKTDQARILKIGVLVGLVVLIVVRLWVFGREEPISAKATASKVGMIGKIRGRIEEKAAGVRRVVWVASRRMERERQEGKEKQEGELNTTSGTVSKDKKDKNEFARRIDVLEFKLARFKLENEALRKQLEAALPPDLELIPSRVIGYSRFLYIDKGKRDGVKKEDAVIAEEILIGQVVEVGEKSAKIRLLSDPDSKIPVRTIKGALGLIVGGEKDNLRLEKVLQREELKEGDLVATSGDSDVASEGGNGFPADLLIGRVDGLLESKKEVYKQANVKPGIEYNRLLYVFVVR